MSRKIPSLMFSQHPDHAHKPYWHDKALIATHHEIKECYLMFKELYAQEMMWDWEGKLVDDSVIERLLARFPWFFKKKPLGRELFLTFRMPNPRVESGYRLGRAMMVIIAARDLAREAGLSQAPLFEVILPLTETAGEILNLQQSFQRLSKAAGRSFGANNFSNQTLEVIPLFEKVTTIVKSGQILAAYLSRYQKYFHTRPDYLRPFLARSDPALNSGIVATTLSIKWALSEYAKLSDKINLPLYPIIAPGALPFRGGLSPVTDKEFLAEFCGIKTLVIQSSFRYDYSRAEVKASLKRLLNSIPQSFTRILPADIFPDLQTLINWFEKPYKQTVEMMAPLINQVSLKIPQRRERVQHIGLFGYSREVGKVKLPRAIGFTASCYSLGIPPELFGIGPGLIKAQKAGKLLIIEKLYQSLKPSLVRAGRYLRKDSLKELGLTGLVEEIKVIEKYLGEELGPQTESEIQHQKIAGKIVAAVEKKRQISRLIESAALLRRSLG